MAARPVRAAAGLTVDDGGAPHFLGHRERLVARFVEIGGEALPDYELLELVLFKALPRRDVKPVAKALIARFGGFAGVLAAPLDRLTEVEGVGRSTAIHLKAIEAAAQRQARGAIEARTSLTSFTAVLDYCRSRMAHSDREHFRILFLDKRNQLIRDEKQAEGTVDHVPVYPREVVRRALELAATAVILVHNHPSGDPTPSQADVKMTREVAAAAATVGVVVHDHLIVARDGHASLKGLGLI
ncbi:MAG: DNA repair protein RadC [Hyphomicrobiales bacterium]|nr:DNA repair protein RadC [Hyphomicrobiales bacterium]MDE2017232.1 DNA repair protein RadC [Hyphomicrobiales bacterium]